jgi:DNA-binding CsgD family transcriptional regulator
MAKLYVPDDKFYASHVTFTSVCDLVEITQPLTEMGLSYFTFDRTYQDGSHLRLTNAGAWIESYYRTELYKKAIFEKDPKMFSNGYVFWDWLSREPVYSAAAEHNIEHGLTITEKHAEYTDFFHIGTTRDNPISQEKLLAHIDHLHRFIAYFKQKARHLIQEAEATRVILWTPHQTEINLHDLNSNLSCANITEFLKSTDVSRIYLGEEFNDTYLTRQEITILQLLTDGSKNTKIAKTLNISERTLESHIKHIKEKFKCDTLFELGYRLGKINVQNLYPFKLNLNPEDGSQ